MSDAAEAKTQEFEERGIPSEAEASIAPPKVEEGAAAPAPAEAAADAAGGVDEAFFSAGFEIFLGRRPGSVKADQLGGQPRAFILRLLKSAEFQTRVLTVLAENGELPHDRWGGVRPNHVEWAQKVVKDQAALQRLSAEGVTWGVVKLVDGYSYDVLFTPDVANWAELIPGYMHVRIQSDLLVSEKAQPGNDVVERRTPFYVYLKPHGANDEAIKARSRMSGVPPIFIPMPPH